MRNSLRFLGFRPLLAVGKGTKVLHRKSGSGLSASAPTTEMPMSGDAGMGGIPTTWLYPWRVSPRIVGPYSNGEAFPRGQFGGTGDCRRALTSPCSS